MQKLCNDTKKRGANYVNCRIGIFSLEFNNRDGAVTIYMPKINYSMYMQTVLLYFKHALENDKEGESLKSSQLQLRVGYKCVYENNKVLEFNTYYDHEIQNYGGALYLTCCDMENEG